MDRIGFIKSISYDNFEKDVQRFFDKSMALFTLVGPCDDLSISADTDADNDKDIVFVVMMDDEHSAELLYERISDKIIPIYGHTYTPELKHSEKSIYIELKETKS